jgi:predicted NBD/HSP70 family sugar kinase
MAADGNGRQSFTASARQALRALFDSGHATRPQLAARLGLSRPTISACMQELEHAGLVETVGEAQGNTGRRASIYRLSPRAGHVIAIDIGAAHVRVRVSTLDRECLHAAVRPVPPARRGAKPPAFAVAEEQVRAAIAARKPGWGRLLAVGAAVPHRIVHLDAGDRLLGGPAWPGLPGLEPDVPLLLENDVNCAAIAEHRHGVAIGIPDFAWLHLGAKIGMGLMLRGVLVSGSNGAAGEVGRLPFPWGPAAVPRRGALEEYLGTKALMARVGAAWSEPAGPDAPPRTVEALFERAEKGHPRARALAERYAADVGAVVSACVGIVDPGLIVLGGSLAGTPAVLPMVRNTVEQLSYATTIQCSSLGAEATLLGIEVMVTEFAYRRLLP